MKIAMLTSGILPIPAIQGGAVENFIDFFLEYNNIHKRHQITVYSVYDKKTKGHPALRSEVNSYKYIKANNLWRKLKRRIHGYLHKDRYYNCYIDYYISKAVKDIEKSNYDVIIMHNRPGYVESLIGKTNAKLVFNDYNDLLNNTTRSNRKIYDALSLIITTSNYIGGRIKTIRDVPNKCITIYAGIDIQKFSPNITPQITREELNLSTNDFVLVFSGRLTPEKGIRELITALGLLCEYPTIKLLIIGSSFFGNTNDDNEFIISLKRQAETMKERIRFTGFIPYELMPSYLKISDVAVIPSLWDDPLPTTVLEAQAMRLPIITTDRGGIPEEVTKSNAIIVPTGTEFEKRFAEAILQVYDNKDLQGKMKQTPDEQIQRFNKERYAKDFFEAIESLVI